jgi:hypothetical protein
MPIGNCLIGVALLLLRYPEGRVTRGRTFHFVLVLPSGIRLDYVVQRTWLPRPFHYVIFNGIFRVRKPRKGAEA